METFFIALAVTAIAIITIPLAVVAAGIRCQEHAASLSTEPPGLAAALTRRLLALHTAPATGTTLAGPAAYQSSSAPPRRTTARPAVIASQARP